MMPQVKEEHLKMAHYPFRELRGSLQYLAVATRPDISNAVSILCQFLQKPGIQHLRATRCALLYLNGTQDLGIQYKRSCDISLSGYTWMPYQGPTLEAQHQSGSK
jgi:hypothetical protein